MVAAKPATAPLAQGEAINRRRVLQAQRAATLGMLLTQVRADYAIVLRRAPDLANARTGTWGRRARLKVWSACANCWPWPMPAIGVAAASRLPRDQVRPTNATAADTGDTRAAARGAEVTSSYRLKAR